jgi:L-alanine-DL-glutamate epimerase-like enolase superfamily enzyme
MNRRSFLQSLTAASAALAARRPVEAKLPAAKITRVRIYEPPNLNRLFNQSNMVVTVETDIGVTGVGEGGAKDTNEQCAGSLIGQNPFQIELLWQEMYMAWFYPPGREKIHAQGAMDMALWDIKGKVLDLPVHQILGGKLRDYCECYATGGAPGTGKLPLAERARAAIEAGYRAFRMGATNTPLTGNRSPFNTREAVIQVAEDCKQAREGVGPGGDWCIDFHQRFDFADALRACRLIEEYAPYFVEDPVRDEQALEDIPKLRLMTACPLAHGEEWGQRWDFNTLVEKHDIDFVRATLPNVGGITEMMKVAAMCETHAVGIVPHFTGPIATAALINCLATFPGPVMLEYNYEGRELPHLSECLDFKQGKAYPNDRPGLGATLDMSQLKLIGEVTEPNTQRRIYNRPDGSLTHW